VRNPPSEEKNGFSGGCGSASKRTVIKMECSEEAFRLHLNSLGFAPVLIGLNAIMKLSDDEAQKPAGAGGFPAPAGGIPTRDLNDGRILQQRRICSQ